MDRADIDNRFTYHAPDEAAQRKHASIRKEAHEIAEWLNHILPEGREKSLAITHLEEVVFWANAAIARREPDGPRE